MGITARRILPCLGYGENGLRRRNPGQSGAFHEALPFVERVGMLAGEKQIASRDTLQSGYRGELSRFVAGVAAFHQWIRRPMFEMREILSIHEGSGAKRAREYDVQIAQEPLGFCLDIVWIQACAPRAAGIVGQHAPGSCAP